MADELHDEISESLAGLRDIQDLFNDECECCGEHDHDDAQLGGFGAITSIEDLRERLQNKVNWKNVAAITLGTFAYYATPDFISSRKLRGLTKGALITGLGALYYPRVKEDVASTWGELREIEKIILENEDEINAEAAEQATETQGKPNDKQSKPETVGGGCGGDCANCSCGGEKLESDELLEMIHKQRMVLVTGTAIIGIISASAAVIGEKFIYRRAQRKRADGVHAAHTKQAWKLGLVSGLTSLTDELFG